MRGKDRVLFYIALVVALLATVEGKNKCKGRKPRKGSKNECTPVSGKKPVGPPKTPPKAPQPIPEGPLMYSYQVVDTMARDDSIFTQGLEIWKPCSSCDESIFTSSGLQGKSFIVQKDLRTGETLQRKDLPEEEFGEGLTILDKKMYQVIWQTNTLYAYDAENFENVEKKEHPAPDGWGLANDGKHLIISNGTEVLTFVKPKDTTKTVKQLSVTFNGSSVTNLNELEWVDGVLYANVWRTDCIAKIDPSNGNVFGWIDASDLKKKLLDEVEKNGGDVNLPDTLNGVAVRPGTSTPLYVTGKFWPTTFIIEEKAMNGGKPMSDADIEKAKQACLFDDA